MTLAGWVSPKPIDPGDVKLITRVPQTDPTSMQALIRGRLWIDDGCVKIGETLEAASTTIWREGFVAAKDDKGVFIHHPDDKARHRPGQTVRFGGGYLSSFDLNFIEGGSFKGCPGPFVVIDDMTVVTKRFWHW